MSKPPDDPEQQAARPRPARLPRLLAIRSSTAWLLTVACGAIFADVFIFGLFVPALPNLVQEISRLQPEKTQTWVTTLLAVYGVVNALASPGFGYVADRGNTRRYSFMFALLAMMASMVLFSVSRSRPLLVVARVLQGIGAAGVWVVSLAVVVDTVEQEHVGSAMGYVSLAMTSGNVLGPMIGGFLYGLGGFQVIFITAMAIIGLTIVARLTMIEVQSARRILASKKNVAHQDYGTSKGRSPSGASIEGEIRTPQDDTFPPVSPKSSWSLFATKRFLVILGSICATSAFYSAFDTILPLQTMRAFHWTPAGSGLMFLPLSAPTLLSPWLGGLVDKYGARIIALAGFTAALPCYIALGFVTNNTLGHKILMCVALLGAGSCLICQMVPLMAEVSKVVDRKDSPSNDVVETPRSTIATGYALFNAAYAAGILIGALVAGFVCETAGWMVTNLVLGVISVLVAVPLYFTGEIGQPLAEEEEPLLGQERSSDV